MNGFTPEQDGTAALAEIDLESGACKQRPLTKGQIERDQQQRDEEGLSGEGGAQIGEG